MRTFLSRRWSHLVLALAVPVWVAVVHWLLFAPIPSSQRTWDAYESLREGMTRQEVHAILGAPPGNYATRPGHFCLFMASQQDERCFFPDGQRDPGVSEWVNDDALILVAFDEDGRVRRTFITSNMSRGGSIRERLRDQFQRLLP